MAAPRNFTFANAKLIRGGEFYLQKLIERIDASHEQIIINVYTFELDESGSLILKHLIKASQRGVKVYILLDSIGSWNLNQSFVEKMKGLGIDVTFFNPLFHTTSFKLGRRLHQKIFIFDQIRAFIGGINISNEYLRPGDSPVWLDYVLYLRGEVVLELARLAIAYHRKNVVVCNSVDSNRHEIIGHVEVLIQDFWKGKFEILTAYYHKISRAKKTIMIMNAYFFPETWFLNLLKKKAKQGVSVKLILGKVSDVKMAQWATHALYEDLLKCGVEIDEWNPSVLHAKMAIIDDTWCTIGSFNIDYLSKFGNIEMNIASEESFLVRQIQNEFVALEQENLEKINIMSWNKKTPWYFKLRNKLAYVVFKLLRVILVPRYIEKGRHEKSHY